MNVYFNLCALSGLPHKSLERGYKDRYNIFKMEIPRSSVCVFSKEAGEKRLTLLRPHYANVEGKTLRGVCGIQAKKKKVFFSIQYDKKLFYFPTKDESPSQKLKKTCLFNIFHTIQLQICIIMQRLGFSSCVMYTWKIKHEFIMLKLHQSLECTDMRKETLKGL